MTRIAVVDVETTGLNPYCHDRIIELAAVVMSLDGMVIREFASLVNPERDIGPTQIHGLTTRDIASAPRFHEVAGALIDALEGCVAVAGHNVRFDHSFLSVEFSRLGYVFPDKPTPLCTMHLSGGGTLSRACLENGITAEGESHTASHDAHATARLLARLLKSRPELASELSSLPAMTWPCIPDSAVAPLTRDVSRQRTAGPPTFIQKLLERVQPDISPDAGNHAVLAYTALLDQVLEDRYLDEGEGQALFDLAEHWAIPASRIRKANRRYLSRLATAALADGVVIDMERRDLDQVASLLGIDSASLDKILEVSSRDPTGDQDRPTVVSGKLDREDFAGLSVCFSGQFQCRLNGQEITRAMGTAIVTGRGMITAKSVTKKLDLLIVADPLTQSGKAKKARQYGIRMMHELVFWRAIGLEVE